MTEREKMGKGLLYDGNYDEELLALRAKCRDLCVRYNQLLTSQTEEKAELFHQLLPHAAETVCMIGPFWCDYGVNIHIGDSSFLNFNCVMLDEAEIRLGSYVFVAPNCGFYTAEHPRNVIQRNAGLEYAHPITVGDNVWIGAGVSVLPGVTIGSNTIIGAGSVVNRDIPSGVLAAGNPCRVIRQLTEEELYGDGVKADVV